MKIKNNLLDIYVNSVNTQKLNHFDANYALTLSSSGHIDLGFKKKINNIFFEFKTANTVDLTVSVQKWTGSTWQSLTILDETEGFKKSGFIFLDEDHTNTQQLHNGIDQIWYRIKVSANTSAMIVNGINLVFCNETDLKKEEPAIASFYPRNTSSHIQSLMAARDYILRRINNSAPLDYYVYSIDPLVGTSYIESRNLTQFDLFDINEIRDAATYYTLHKIFSNRSDAADDVYKQKSDQYLALFESSFALWKGRKLTLDIDDNGKESQDEKNASIKTITLFR